MNDPAWLLGSGLWITGLALLLALSSYQGGAAASSEPSPPTLGGIALSEWELLGQFLVCVGLLFTSQDWLEQMGWTLLLFLCLRRAWGRWGRKAPP